MFERGSRYEDVATAIHVGPDGRQHSYKLLRRIPDLVPRQVHLVVAGDRLDLIAYSYFRDPEQFWRICDANRCLDPADLLAAPARGSVGRRLLIPAPQVTP